IAVGAWIRSRIAGGGKLRDCRVLNRKGGPASAHRRCGCDRATIRHEVVVKAYPSPVGGRLRASPRSVAVLKCHPQRREAVAERDVERRQGLAGWCVGIAWRCVGLHLATARRKHEREWEHREQRSSHQWIARLWLVVTHSLIRFLCGDH